MSEASKPTPGPWLRDRESGFDCDVRAANGRKIASVNVQSMAKTKQQFDGRKAENEANACLIAEAGTVHHETGLTPRQLVEQRDALAEALGLLLHEVDDSAIAGAKDYGWPVATAKARAALALVKGSAP